MINTAQKTKFSFKDFFDFLRIWSHLPKKSLMENFIFCAVKTEHVIHIRNLKQALNHGLVLKVHKFVIKFNKYAWLKPYIDMNTDLTKQAKK